MNGAPWGGSEELWFRAAIYAATQGHHVGAGFYQWDENTGRVKALEAAGVKVYQLPNQGRRKSSLAEKLRYEWITKLQLRSYVRKLPVQDYDVVVVNQGGFMDMCSGPWKRFNQKLRRYALVFHNYQEKMDLSSDKREILRNWIERAAVNLFAAGRIRVVLEDYFQFKISNGVVLYNPISFAPPASVNPYPQLQDGKYVFLTLSALDTGRKAQDQLIKTLSTEKWKQRNWVLHMYGEGRDKQMLQELINSLDMQEKIILKGHTRNAEEVISAAHLVLQLTWVDAMPLTVVEALSLARPVAVTRIGDMPHWIEDGVNGWVAGDASEKSIDEVLEKAWQERERWPEMGAQAFQVFQARFPANPAARFLEEVFSSVETKQTAKH